MKTCSSCGHVQNDGNFCGKCGGKFEGAAEVQTATLRGATTRSAKQRTA